MNAMPKIVVSSTLDNTTWNRSTVLTGDIAEAMTAHKSQPGRDLLVLGSPKLTAHVAHLGLFDELRVMVNPVALGAGKSLFTSTSDRLHLQLLDTRTFESGNVLLTYRPSVQGPASARPVPSPQRAAHPRAQRGSTW